MQTRKIGPFDVSAIGLGCMVLSHAYGNPPDPKTAADVLLKALDLGYTHFDTATLYGFGANETLLGNTLKHRRNEFMLASKCGMFRGASGGKEIDGHPAILKQNLEDSLKRLQTDVIDLYYLHRWDKRIPIEDSIGAMSDMVKAGKVKEVPEGITFEGEWYYVVGSQSKTTGVEGDGLVRFKFDPNTGEDVMSLAQMAISPPTAPADRDPNNPASWGKVGRNENCPCGSGKKYKHCHGRFG